MQAREAETPNMHDRSKEAGPTPPEVGLADIAGATGRGEARLLRLAVAVPIPLRKTFDYRLSSESLKGCHQPGARVLVEFGNRKLVAVITDCQPGHPEDEGTLKTIEKLLDSETPSLPPPVLELGQWAAGYYQAPLGEVLAAALPPALRQEKAPAPPRQLQAWTLTEEGHLLDPESLNRSPRQQQALRRLGQADSIPTTMLVDEGISRSVLRNLEQKGLIETTGEGCEIELPLQPSQGYAPPVLNAEQQQAVTAISEDLGRFQASLLDGVTGSGKTEVYLHLIEKVLDAGQQALVLVPEISLTPQTLKRFAERFGAHRVIALHSGLGAGERLAAWQSAAAGRADVIIATRSGIFTPLPMLGIIIIDEEHDSSFKQQDGVRYSARDLGLVRAQQEQAPVLLGSATPSLETLRNAELGRYAHLRLTQRAGSARMPRVRVEDTRGQRLQGGLSPALIGLIRVHIGAGNQVMVFLNRRGYAPVLMCQDCGWTAECRHCDSRMTMHVSTRQLRCHHCQSTRGIPGKCPGCHGEQLIALGAGTQRTDETLQELFPETPVIRIDRDTTNRKSAYEDFYARMLAGEPCILVGTQMLAKGHDFPGITLVAILDADQGLMSSDFRGVERTGQLIWQVAGRAGRAERPGEVFLQTCQPQHPALGTLLGQGYPAFAAQLLQERQVTALPPYTSLCLIRADASQAGPAMQFLQEVAEALPSTQGQIECWGPAPSPMQKKAGRFRAQLVLCSASRAALQQVLADLCTRMEQSKLGRKLRWSVDVDPVDLF